jgi:hypothetical protein
MTRHQQEMQPGLAHLETLPSGEKRYFCTCHPRADGWSLAEMYAATITGVLRQLAGTELQCWQV